MTLARRRAGRVDQEDAMLKVVKLRMELGWSQARLARAARIDQSNMSRIERGLLAPYPGQLRRLARALRWPAQAAHELLAQVAPQEPPVGGPGDAA
jgi:transcriptional regulator with XRE-family HTH domain